MPITQTISRNVVFSESVMTNDYIGKIYKEWASIKAELESIVVQYQKISAEKFDDDRECIGFDLEKTKREFESNIQVLNAIMKIASAHTSKRTVHSEEFSFDKKKLSMIQVQIDPHSSDDPAAAELFYEAYGQQNYLRRKCGEIEKAAVKMTRDRLRQQADDVAFRQASLDSLLRRYMRVLSSSQFASFLKSCSFVELENHVGVSQNIFLGYQEDQIPIPLTDDVKFKNAIKQTMSTDLNNESYAIKLPLLISLDEGASVAIGFSSEKRTESFEIVQFILLQALSKLHSGGALKNATYIDPATFSPLSLGDLAVLTSGVSPVINEVPRSAEGLRHFFDALRARFEELDKKYLEDKNSHLVTDVFVIRSFPAAYDSSALSVIRKLVVMAKAYKILVLLEVAPGTAKSASCADMAAEVINGSVCYGDSHLFGGYSTREVKQGTFDFLHDFTDKQSLIRYLFDASHNELSSDNRYLTQVRNQTLPAPIKGNRAIDGIPIGLAENGEILRISLENENYAAFICGASRSGKSTLLHTFLSGVFSAKHPDDVEVWLIDFKMTEFSRYIRFTPPHIRYIVLDESPEVVYDLLDRLFEVLSKRQAIFKKNGWTKLSDAQDARRYMPALLVVVDEFSILSKIVSDSALVGKDYKDKLQILLSKGAALGFRFIFSSQGFTQGTRGLSDYSKQQIQLRIAMKTEYSEIRETLDIPHASDAERCLMEDLAPHYALVRAQTETGNSNRLRKAHVLYFEEADEQIQYLSGICSKYSASDFYDETSFDTYIYKQTQVFDGNETVDFLFAKEMVANAIAQLKKNAYDKSIFYICLGQPVRMRPVFPIEMTSGYSENILFIVPPSRGMAFQSAVATMAFAAKKQNVQLKIVVLGNGSLLPPDFIPFLSDAELYYGADGLRSFISETKTQILNYGIHKTESLTIVLGADSLFGSPVSRNVFRDQYSKLDAEIVFEPRKAGEADLISQIRNGSIGVETDSHFASRGRRRESGGTLSEAVASLRLDGGLKNEVDEEDLGNVLKDLLEDGPRYGAHFLVAVSDVQEIKKCGISLNSFRHKVTFRISQEDARSIAPRLDAIAIADLTENNYRYTNGIDGVTLRPYAHSDKNLFGVDADIDQEYLL